MVAFDKTGTLTMGKIQVTDCKLFAPDGLPSDPPKQPHFDDESSDDVHLYRLFSLILAVECRSNHPIAKGIVDYCAQQLSGMDVDFSSPLLQGISNVESNQFQSIIGKGVKMALYHTDGSLANTIIVGSASMLSVHGIKISSAAEQVAYDIRSDGKIVVFVAVNDVFIALLGLGDQIRPEARLVLDYLRRIGMECHMLTGDNEVTAKAIASELGIESEHILASASPKDKEVYVMSLQTRLAEHDSALNKVAFVGDGTNDTPALSKAQVGFVMSTGTDLALEYGDVILCKNSLTSLVTAIDLSHQTMRKIYMNYFWALIYNSILVPIAAGVLIVPFNFKLNPMVAGGAMAISSVSVVVSSLFLTFYIPPDLEKEHT